MLTWLLVTAAMAVIVLTGLALVGVVAFPYRGRRVPASVPRARELNELLGRIGESPALATAKDPGSTD